MPTVGRPGRPAARRWSSPSGSTAGTARDYAAGALRRPDRPAAKLSGTISRVSVVETVLARIPEPYRTVAIQHRELVKFALVGACTWVIDTVVFIVLKSTVLVAKPVTAKVIAVLVATIVSYVLNREWSFRTRGGHERRHEAALFFLISGVGVAVYSAPLAISRYVLELRVPEATLLTQEIADFVSGQIVGVLLGMAFRWWGFRRFVFPHHGARRRLPVA